MNREELIDLHKTLTSSGLDLMKKKNQDYTGASDDVFANFRGSMLFNVEPEIGLMIRMNDKMKRIQSFISNGVLKVEDESEIDSIVDLINYSVLLAGLLQERKQK